MFYFLTTVVVSSFIVIFLLYYNTRDDVPLNIDIRSITTGLYWTVKQRRSGLVVTANGAKNDFYATWSLVADTSGTGSITFRNSYTGGWLYYKSITDRVHIINIIRQPANIDPIGWFYMRSGNNGIIQLESVNNAGYFLTVVESELRVSSDITNADFLLVG